MNKSEILHFMASRFTGNLDEKQTQWSLIPSSRFLVRKMVRKEEIQAANVIVEFWPGTWVFTEEILKHMRPWTKLYLVEINAKHCEFLKKRFPEIAEHIHNIDVREFHTILEAEGVSHIDIIISWLPFRSIPPEVLTYVFWTFLPMFSSKDTLFKQFSYVPSARRYSDYISHILKEFCFINFPPAFVFTMWGFSQEVAETLKSS